MVKDEVNGCVGWNLLCDGWMPDLTVGRRHDICTTPLRHCGTGKGVLDTLTHASLRSFPFAWWQPKLPLACA